MSLLAHSSQLTVGNNSPFTSIASAINAAKPYDTIRVAAGRFHEHSLVISQPLTLLGSKHTIIDAGEQEQDIFVVTGDHVHISGFTLENTGVSYLKEIAAIRIKKAKYGSISGNLIRNCFFGIYLEHAIDFVVKNNHIIGSIENEASAGNAIHVWKGTNIYVTGNTVTGHRDGIYFEFVDSSRISHNISRKNIRYGLHFMFSNNDDYLHNQFLENGAGVAVMFSKKIKMKQNTFADNWGGASYGLLLKEISDGEISGNRFTRNTIGILAEGANRLNIESNSFVLNGTALDMKGNTLDSKIEKNNFIANTFEVITNSRHNSNIYSKNYWSNYSGYDLNRDGTGDVAYRPVNVYAKVTKEIPAATIMLHSFIIELLDRVERLFPTVIPAELTDHQPKMSPWKHDKN